MKVLVQRMRFPQRWAMGVMTEELVLFSDAPLEGRKGLWLTVWWTGGRQMKILRFESREECEAAFLAQIETRLVSGGKLLGRPTVAELPQLPPSDSRKDVEYWAESRLYNVAALAKWEGVAA